MKLKIFLLSTMAFLALSSKAAEFPICNFGELGLQYHKYTGGYRKYIGKTVKYITPRSFSNEDKKFPGEFDTEYIISDIKEGKDKITIFLQKTGDKKAVKWTVANGENLQKYYFFAITESYTIPLILIDELKAFKERNVGKIISDDRINFDFRIIDFELSYPSWSSARYPRPMFVVENGNNGAIKRISFDTDIVKACFSEFLTGANIATLQRVEKPSDESIRYGETQIVEDKGITKFSYKDNVLDVLIFTGGERFIFDIKNVSAHTIKIIWDEAVFVGFNGRADKIIHSGIKYSEKNNSQPSTTIIKGASISDVAIPVSNIEYTKAHPLLSADWKINKMFNEKTSPESGKLMLMLPIQIKDTINEYTFVFDVNWKYDYPQFLIGM